MFLFIDDRAPLQVLKKEESRTIFRLVGDNGSGIITVMRLSSAFFLCLNDMHLFSAPQVSFLKHQMFLEIDHCTLGRFEANLKDGYAVVMEKGDTAVHFSAAAYSTDERHSNFPLTRYRGFTILVDLNQWRQDPFLREALGLNIDAFVEKASSNVRWPRIFHQDAALNEVAESIYEQVRSGREKELKQKCGQFLQCLNQRDYHKEAQPYLYLPQALAEKIYAVAESLKENLAHNSSQQALADAHDISLTSLKEGFRVLYGMPLGAYRRRLRLYAAVHYLQNSSLPIRDIATLVGWQNPAKFSTAFKDYFGRSPTAFRQMHDYNSWHK